MSRRVTIHSDGTGRGTDLILEDGAKIEHVHSMTIRVDAGGMVEAELEIAPTALNMSAGVAEVNFVCPVCGDSMDHKCDTTLGGGDPSWQSKMSMFSYPMCLKMNPAGNAVCYRNSTHYHEDHLDTKQDIGWKSM